MEGNGAVSDVKWRYYIYFRPLLGFIVGKNDTSFGLTSIGEKAQIELNCPHVKFTENSQRRVTIFATSLVWERLKKIKGKEGYKSHPKTWVYYWLERWVEYPLDHTVFSWIPWLWHLPQGAWHSCIIQAIYHGAIMTNIKFKNLSKNLV